MILNICQNDYSIQWDGIYHFALEDYPRIQPFELEKIALFLAYEKRHNRLTKLCCDNTTILTQINDYLQKYQATHPFTPSQKAVAATFDSDGQLVYSDYLSHTCTVSTAIAIFKTGSLLSAVKAFQLTGQELVNSSRNAAGDPVDYFDYVMFGWSNTTSGYRLAMERLLGRLPNQKELEDEFIPGVSFHYAYSQLIALDHYIFDGYHPAKIKHQVPLELMTACIIPKANALAFSKSIPKQLATNVHYLEYDGDGLVQWTQKVYRYLLSISQSDASSDS
ncbi:phosphate ABC transporter ATPase [Streptococcus phocae subsp. phocae]